MATLRKMKTKTGESWRIEIAIAGDRKSIFLGKMAKKTAETIKSRVETINSSNLAGLPYPPDVAQWLGTIGDDLHEKLSSVGLVPARHAKILATFLEAYKAERVDAKPNTIKAWNTSIKRIINYFGDVPLRSVTAEQAAQYRVSLVRDGYKEATIAKMIGLARLFFGTAKKRKLIDENPFQEVRTGCQVNKERQHYVSQEETDHLVNACMNAKQRLIIALGRFAGLRIPSELVGLRWSEVNWETGRFIVHSPKTERHGKGKRVVPIFEKLYPYLTEAFETAPEGEDRIFPEITEKKSMGSWIHKLADRAGIVLWEKPFQNMRSSCATDLVEIYPRHVCEAWLGHTGQIADKHYRQVLDSHFEKASHRENAGNTIGGVRTKNGGGDVTLLESQENVKKSCAVPAGISSQDFATRNKNAVNCGVLQPTASGCNTQNCQITTKTYFSCTVGTKFMLKCVMSVKTRLQRFGIKMDSRSSLVRTKVVHITKNTDYFHCFNKNTSNSTISQ